MSLKNHEIYFLSVDGDECNLASYSQVINKIEIALEESTGKISLAADDGLRPWWQRFIFGAEKYIRYYFLFEWSGNVSGLIFHDVNASEYRAMQSQQMDELPEHDRMQICFGEETPVSTRFCIAKDEASKAIYEFLETGEIPSWLQYEFIR